MRNILAGRAVPLAALFLFGCAATPAARPRQAQVAPPAENFGTVSAGVLYRGARPDAAAIHQLRVSACAIKTIVNLELEDDDLTAIRRENVRYFHLPIIATPFFWAFGDDAQVKRFLDVMNQPENQPVYVHCRHGADRTGEVVAAYRMLVQGWGYDRAVSELTTYHHFDLLYPQVRAYLKSIGRLATAKVAKS